MDSCGGNFAELRNAECSGHGSCLFDGTGLCLCDKGWTGTADILGRPYIDCHIHITTVLVLWSLAGAVVLAVFLVGFPRTNWRQIIRPRQFVKGLAKHASIRCAWCFVLVALLLFTLSVYKVVHYPDPFPAIGSDIVATILYTYAGSFFYMGLINNIWMWEAVVVQCAPVFRNSRSFGTTDIERQFMILKLSVGGIVFLTSATFHLLFVIYGVPEAQNTLAAIFWIGRGFFLFSQMVAEQISARRLLVLLRGICDSLAPSAAGDEPVEDPCKPLRELTKRIERYLRSNASALGGSGILSMLTGAWPFLRTMGSYVLPITIISYIAVIDLVRALPIPNSRGAPTPSGSHNSGQLAQREKERERRRSTLTPTINLLPVNGPSSVSPSPASASRPDVPLIEESATLSAIQLDHAG